MAAGYGWACDTCGRTAETSGPQEFYRDASGKIKDYGRPAPVNAEAENAGVWGLTGSVLCGRCGTVAEMILEKFRQPSTTEWEAWFGPSGHPEESLEFPDPRCPKCGGAELFLEPPAVSIPGPWCKDGRLKSAPAWIS
jgi:hypothetical protein